ncbi:PREDICTED: nucleosome assembly protein 1;2-like isoform X2 [Populus euphratica]|uniref:Nucleosome assembly protein 12-like isoform X2 n=1 Tax=Populus euphratica TaxID=75702 RepID=A0AAJ6TPZ5_POPEU|nr:PREDICTED: nucleosome assembly protein 1;2-like isoform X2 [Populus euphratica]
MKVSSSPKVSKHVECLRHLQSQHDELEAQFLEERRALEAKYNKLYQPLYTKRYEIVNGLKEVDGVMSAKLDSIKEDQAIEEKGVPEFWLTAMKTHEVLAEEIKGQDEGALKFIKDIKWSRLQNPEGFELEFYFNPCPYFKNSVLTKTYHIIDESDPILSQAIGTEIEWYPEKCLTKKVVKRKQRMVSKKTKTTMTIKNCESFFTFFNPPQIPENEDDLDDDDYDELQDRLKRDYNIGIIIRDKIIPHAVSWFTGEAIEEDELDGIDYDGNGDGDDDDDDDDDDDEDEVEDEENDDGDEEDNESDKEVEQEEKRKLGVKKDIKKDYDEDEDEEKERKWGLKKDEDDDDEAEDEENDDGDEGDNESDQEAEQEEKRKQGVKKDNQKDCDEDEDEDGDENEERKWDLKKDDDDEAEDEENDDGDEKDNESDKEAEQEEKRKQGVKKDIKEDNDEDGDEEKERKWGLKKDVEDEDKEEEEEKQSSDGHKKIGGPQIQKGQQREHPPECKQQ